MMGCEPLTYDPARIDYESSICRVAIHTLKNYPQGLGVKGNNSNALSIIAHAGKKFNQKFNLC